MSKFSPSARKHAYNSPQAAAELLPLLYQFMQMPSHDTIEVGAKSRSISTVRQRLVYARQFLTEVDEGTFRPYSELAANLIVRVSEDIMNLDLKVRPEFYSEAIPNFHITPLFSFFAAADIWLAQRSGPVSYAKKWNPPLDTDLLPAIERFVQMRPAIAAHSLSTTICILSKS